MKAPNAPALVGVVPAGKTAATTTVLPGSVVWLLVFRMPSWLTVFADITENSNPMWKASFEPFEKLFTVKASWEFWACAIPAPGNPTKINPLQLLRPLCNMSLNLGLTVLFSACSLQDIAGGLRSTVFVAGPRC
jgi:hypothetical protein